MKVVCSVAICLLAATVCAQDKKPDPINPDRPDQTNGAGITPIGKWVVELGYRQTASGGTLQEWGDQPTWRYGISEKFELRLITPAYAVSAGQKGWEDSGVGFKYLLHDGSGGWSKPSFALQGQTSFPSGSGGFRNKQLLPSLIGIVDWDFGSNGDLGANVGAASQPGASGKSFLLWSATLSYNHSLGGPLAGFLEGYALIPTAGNGPTGHYSDAGLQYLLNNDCMLDAFVGTQLDQHRQTAFFGGGVSFRF